MNEITERNLPHTRTMIFEHKSGHTSYLLDEVADYLDTTGATLLSIVYHNTIDGEYSESVVVTVELA